MSLSTCGVTISCGIHNISPREYQLARVCSGIAGLADCLCRFRSSRFPLREVARVRQRPLLPACLIIIAMPRGGKRPNTRRPKGRRDKRTVLMELLPALDESDRQLPLYRLLTRIADESEDIRYRDALSIACLPCLHSRLVSNMVVKPAYLMSDEELQQVRAAEPPPHPRTESRGS